MTQAVFIGGGRRPPTKKALKEAVAADPSRVYLEDTSIGYSGYDGPVTEMPLHKPIAIVGPEPYLRKWYGTITRTDKGVTVK